MLLVAGSILGHGVYLWEGESFKFRVGRPRAAEAACRASWLQLGRSWLRMLAYEEQSCREGNDGGMVRRRRGGVADVVAGDPPPSSESVLGDRGLFQPGVSHRRALERIGRQESSDLCQQDPYPSLVSVCHHASRAERIQRCS